MFLGEYKHNLDTKGRIILPSKFRENITQALIITKGLDNCIFAYPSSEWMSFESKLKELPITDISARRFIRFFIGGAFEVVPDNQGRILIPHNLRDYAGIKKEVVSIGAINKIEIWGCENWQDYNKSNYIDDALSEKMSLLGI
jgi:MraZ protein